MSMRQYLRQISVEIEGAGRSVLIIEELRITFDLHIDDQSSSSPSTVKIWNLAKASASHIAEPRQVVRVKAGYGDITNSAPIFDGEIRRVLHERTGVDRVTTIVLGRSDSATTGALVSISLVESCQEVRVRRARGSWTLRETTASSLVGQNRKLEKGGQRWSRKGWTCWTVVAQSRRSMDGDVELPTGGSESAGMRGSWMRRCLRLHRC